MKDIRIPDYRLSRVTGKLYRESLEYRAFNLYINEQAPLDDKSKLIVGTIEDHFGTADFYGMISEKFFIISVNYRKDAIEIGAPKEYTVYIGEKRKSAYVGTFMLNSEINPLDFNQIIKIIPTGDYDNYRFGAKKFDPKKFPDITPKPIIKRRFDSTYIDKTWN